jgi:hypothetical protein
MPFTIKKVKGGYKVFSPTKALSKTPMNYHDAHKQLIAITINYRLQKIKKM